MKEIVRLIKNIDIKGLFIVSTQNEILQFLRYVFVGGIATIVDWSILFLLTDIVHIYHLISACFSFFAGLIVNFLLSKLMVFKTEKAKMNGALEFVAYAIIGAVGLGVTELIMFGFTDCLKFYYMISNVIATVVTLVWNYIARKIIIYSQV